MSKGLKFTVGGSPSLMGCIMVEECKRLIYENFATEPA